MIDHILLTTGYSKILYIGHSQGTTQFWVMTSVLPEYNSVIALAVGLAPAAFTGHLRGPVTQLTKLTYFGVVGHDMHIYIKTYIFIQLSFIYSP